MLLKSVISKSYSDKIIFFHDGTLILGKFLIGRKYKMLLFCFLISIG